MEQTPDHHMRGLQVSASAKISNHLLRTLLLVGVLITGLAVWLLRLPASKSQWWPWLLLLAGMFTAAKTLAALDLLDPGEAILPSLQKYATSRRRTAGATCIALALALTGLIVWRLWPDYQNNWRGMPILWAACVLLLLVGCWLISAVGHASPRAATALRRWPNTRWSRWMEAGIFVLILLLAIFLRVYRIDNIPPGIYVNETDGGLDAINILEGHAVSPFATGWYQIPNAYMYYFAAVLRLLGINWLGLKVVSLIPALLTIPAVYLLGRAMFGPAAGLSGMFFMAVSRWHLSMSRWGWAETPPPFLQVLAVFFLIRGLRDRRATDYALSGILATLSLYCYPSGRLVLATMAAYCLYWLLSDPSGLRASVRRSGYGIALVAAAGVIIAAPLAVTYVRDPFTFNNRVSELSVLRQVQQQGTLAPLAYNVLDTLRFFHQTGDLQGKHNLPAEPMIDPFTGALFAIGIGYMILSIRDQRRVLLGMWLILAMAGSYLSLRGDSPDAYRTLTAAPAVALIAGDTLVRMASALFGAMRGTDQPTASKRLLAQFVTGSLAVLVCMAAAIWESSVFFGPQARSTAVLAGFDPAQNGTARETVAALSTGKSVYISPTISTYSPLRFRVYGYSKANLGINSLTEPPYHLVVPGSNLPLPINGHDAVILLDPNYSALSDFVTALYPEARVEEVQLPDGTGLYKRISVSREQIANLGGLTEVLSYADGHSEKRMVPGIGLAPQDTQADKVTWTGSVQLQHGGSYEVQAAKGLEVFLGDSQLSGTHYFGQGLYAFRAVWTRGSDEQPSLHWLMANKNAAELPVVTFYNISPPAQGLRAAYWENLTWAGDPLFERIEPFMLLYWPDEPPIIDAAGYTARFTGALKVDEPGTYNFLVHADDGARVILDGNLIGEAMETGKANSFEASVELAAGKHPIEIDYIQTGGGATLELLWRRSSGPWMPIPPRSLVPAEP